MSDYRKTYSLPVSDAFFEPQPTLDGLGTKRVRVGTIYGDAELTIDVAEVARRLGYRALGRKSQTATLFNGLIKVKIRNSRVVRHEP